MDLILRNARVRGHDNTVDIAINNGLITKIAPCRAQTLRGRHLTLSSCAA
jgi:dihydroorotase-like cyclic amidohydrolase